MSRSPVIDKYSRRIPTTISRAVKKHARHSGEISFVWNLLQDAFFHMFWGVVGDYRGDRHAVAHALWHSIQSDKTQREMLREAAIGRPDLPPEFVEDITWAVKVAEYLAVFRNDAVHTPVRFAVLPNETLAIYQKISGRKQAVDRLAINPTASVWLRVRGDLVVLVAFCELVYRRHAAHGPNAPSTRRPPLSIVPRDTQAPQHQAKGKRRGKRQRRQPSSQA